jgi:glycosyltransferase 2 family protein
MDSPLIRPSDSPGTATRPARRGQAWLKLAVTISLYVLVFWWSDAGATFARLRTADVSYVAFGVVLYAAGQAMSAWRWWLLLAPVRLVVAYARLLGFYFIGMFFNLFLPTIVGGDAVKALLLTRETRAPARAMVSVFMERNMGLAALLLIGTVAAWQSPDVVLGGRSLLALTLTLSAGFVAANVVLLSPHAYRLVDRLVARGPLARLRGRAASLYEAIEPYRSAWRTLAASFALSLAFQGIVIGVVFLNALALDQAFPFSAVAVFVPLISLAGMIPISVNGLGVREALYLLLFGRIGASPEVAVSLAFLYLAVIFVASLPGGLVYALQRTPPRLADTGLP